MYCFDIILKISTVNEHFYLNIMLSQRFSCPRMLNMHRDGWRHLNGWIFGKVPNCLWNPLIFGKSCYNFFLQTTCTTALFTSPKAAVSIFWLKWYPSPPFESFPKIHLFLYRHLSPKEASNIKFPVKDPSLLFVPTVSPVEAFFIIQT